MALIIYIFLGILTSLFFWDFFGWRGLTIIWMLELILASPFIFFELGYILGWDDDETNKQKFGNDGIDYSIEWLVATIQI